MAKAKELNESASKLVQWLNEAHAKEAELEADLTAHIGLTEKASYKKRLQEQGKLKINQDVITRLVQSYNTRS